MGKKKQRTSDGSRQDQKRRTSINKIRKLEKAKTRTKNEKHIAFIEDRIQFWKSR